jgi:gamma-glutamyl hercynylcysteine S-oxide synthase
MRIRRLLPEPGAVETDDLPRSLALADLAHEARPYVVANMVQSIDGRATVAGRSGPLGGDADRELFHGLRTAVDAVFTGTGTLRAENYGRLVRNPERRERRVAAGLDPEPVAVVVSRRGSIPWSIPMFEEPEQRVLVFSEAELAAPPKVEAQVQVIRLEDARPVAVLERLRADFGIRSVLSEGGPTLLSGLVADEVLEREAGARRAAHRRDRAVLAGVAARGRGISLPPISRRDNRGRLTDVSHGTLPSEASPMRSAPTAATDPAAALDALDAARRRTLRLIDGVAEADLERVHSKLMSPLVWDLGHIAAFEDLWLVHRFGGEPMRRPELGHVYDAFETPRAYRGELEFLSVPEARAYLDEVRIHAGQALHRLGVNGSTVPELVVRHELQHAETMLQTLQLARIDGYDGPGRHRPPPAPASGPHTGLETVEVPAGRFLMGASGKGFAYDNERPRHAVEVPSFRIGRTPITNATWLRFSEGGGYERREWWTDEAWHWKEEYDITHPGSWTDDGHEWRMGRCELIDPDKPVVHVSWFEADAFARAHGVRLPTEAEWEKAATWDQETGSKRDWPWGHAAPATRHGNLGARVYGTAPAGAYPEGASPYGALGMVGDVWEWTAGPFGGYPGFRADPYPEYSEVFFGDDYRVLRGGSWATAERVATPTFRNWDYPQRRQIFAGVRIAEDVA